MTDAELIARLRDEHVAASRTEAADRIELLATTNEQLVATNEALIIVNAALTADRDKQAGYKEDYRAVYGEACLQLQETEAKLAECLERNALLEARLGKAVEALEALIQQTHDCEKELTEDLHHMDFCGESEPLTKARTTLAEIKSHSDEFATQKGETHE